jgi:Calx-beta domain-containing protein
VRRRALVRAATLFSVATVVVAATASNTWAAPRRRDTRDFTVSNAVVAEPAPGYTVSASFVVTLTSAPTRPVFLLVHTHDGTAQHRTGRRGLGDYDSVWGWLRFTPGEPLTKTVSVRVHGDRVLEGTETFELRVWDGRNRQVGTGTITPPGETTTPPTTPPTTTPPTTTPPTTTPPTTTPPTTTPPSATALTVTDGSVFEPATGGLSDATVTVRPTVPLGNDLVLDYRFVGVDATEGVDFQAGSGTLVFAAGSTVAQDVVVTVIGDENVEPDETVDVVFSVHGSTAAVSPSFATVTILDDDSGNGGVPVDPQ